MISGTTQVTSTIAPSSVTDIYATHDAKYGKGGLTSVADNTERNALPSERRSEGMLIVTLDATKYWRLKPSPWAFDDTDWELAFDLSTGPAGGTGTKKVIALGEIITVPASFQYLLYGDLTVNGTLNVEGEVTLINGNLIIGPLGVFNNTGTLTQVSLELAGKKYKATFSSTANVPFTLTHNLNTLDFVYLAREGNNDISLDLVRLNTTQVQITTSANVSGSITIVGY